MSVLRRIDPNGDYDFVRDEESLFNRFQKVGRKYINEKFMVFKEDADVIHSIIGYLGNDELLEQFKLDRDKGLCFYGPLGCGKTAFLIILKSGQKDREFLIINAVTIVNQFMTSGPKIIDQYINEYQTLCIDDFGSEKDGVFYGNSINVISQILKGRCERSQFRGKCVTHVATKTPIDDLRKRYGEEIISIMNSMFNPVIFEEDSKDKRLLGL